MRNFKHNALILFCAFVLPVLAHADKIVLSGTIVIDKPLFYENKEVVIDKGTAITIPKNLEFGIHIKRGSLKMAGSPENPITVTSPSGHDDLEDTNLFFIEDSKADISNTIFHNTSWALHMHNTSALITNCLFENNYGGVRFLGSDMVLQKNIFIKNQIGIRFLNGSPAIKNNVFIGNKTALYLREGVESAVISHNAFLDNTYDLYAGFFQSRDINAGNNYFVSQPSVFDNRKDENVEARIITDPVLAGFPDWH